jgi:hypothetical protein
MVRLHHPIGRACGAAFVSLLLFVPLILLGCSSGSNPVMPSPGSITPQSGLHENSGRTLWGWYNMHVSADHSSVTVEPVRNALFHLNALLLVETLNPDSLAVTAWTLHDDGTITAAVKMSHPLGEDETRTIGFDLRGIVMFPSQYEFPTLQALTPGILVGQNAHLNPDGYTRRWNPTEYAGAPAPFNYFDGSMIKAGKGALCTATVNPYIAFWTNPDRRMFMPGGSDERLYHLSFAPGPMTFAYAIDVSWGVPDAVDDEGKPVEVPGSFPLTCNSIEPYTIEIKEITGKLECSLGLYAGGSASVSVYTADWQDNASVFLDHIRLEAPALFDGTVSHASKAEGKGYTYYGFDITNQKAVLPGEYPVLLAMDLPDSDPYWLGDVPLTAYQLFSVEVVEINPPFCLDKNTIHSVGPGIYDIDNSYSNTHNDCAFMPISVGGQGGLLFDGGKSGNTEHIQYAAISGTGGVADAATLIFRSGTEAGNATFIEANEHTGHLLIFTNADPDNLLVYNTFGQKLLEKDLGTGNHEPVLMTSDQSNGDIWMVVHLDDGAIQLERWAYIYGGPGLFDYAYDPDGTVDLMPYMTVNPRPLGLAINSHFHYLYFFHADINGSVEVFNITTMPPVQNETYSRIGVMGAPITPTAVPSSRRLIGADLLIDHVNGEEVAQCRILAFANVQGGTSRLTRLDAWCQTLATGYFSGQYACATLNNLYPVEDRALILFPLTGSMNYSIFLAPDNW